MNDDKRCVEEAEMMELRKSRDGRRVINELMIDEENEGNRDTKEDKWKQKPTRIGRKDTEIKDSKKQTGMKKKKIEREMDCINNKYVWKAAILCRSRLKNKINFRNNTELCNYEFQYKKKNYDHLWIRIISCCKRLI